MDPFFMYVAIGALVLLILILTAIGVAMTQINSLVPFPSTQNTCPDHWDVSGSNPNYCGISAVGKKNNGRIQINSNGKIDQSNAVNIGMCIADNKFGCKASGSPYLANDDNTLVSGKFHYVKLNDNADGWGGLYPGISERCAKKRWASTLDVTWDGVTNFNGC